MSILAVKNLGAKAFLAFSVIIFIYSATFSIKNYLRFSSFKKELSIQEVNHVRLAMQNSGYTKTIDFMEFDQYWILEAKKELGYIHSSEKIYKFYDEGKL